MATTRRSTPFSITILALIALIVVPLSGTLLWLGWRAVDALETRSVDHRMSALDGAVSRFLSEGLRTIVSVGLTLAEAPSFSPQTGPGADDERLRQLAGVLARHPAVAAVYVGYDDGRFLFAGRTTSFSAAQRAEFDAPPGDAVILRNIGGDAAAARQETWWFQQAGGASGAARSRPADYDPRVRPWYDEATRARSPILTEPYRFAQSDAPGITLGVPMRAGGVIGFDFTLGTLSRLIADYKITPSTIILIATDAGNVFMESEPCAAGGGSCPAGGEEARQALRDAIAADIAGRPKDELLARAADHQIIVHRTPPMLGKPFVVAAAVPFAELAADSRTLLRRAALMATAAVVLAILAAFAASLLLSRSLARIAARTERFRNLDFSAREPARSRITEILRLSDAVERMREGLEVFARYVPKDLVGQIMRSPASAGVGGVRRELTVMFTDIEGFSRLSENVEPELLTSRLSRYFEALGACVVGNRGTIDKYIGDSVMAFWNAPEPDPDHVAHACRAALQAAAASRQLAAKWGARNRPVFRTRIGLHCGSAVVGNVGTRDRINYTLVGAVANQASRLEGLNKVYGTEILASGEVAGATAERFVWRHVDRIVAAGTTEALDIHEPLGEIESAAEHAEFLDRWSKGRAAYVAGRFDAAIGCFRAATALRPGDGPCSTFIARCTELERVGLPAGWDGAWRFDKK